MLRSFKNHCEKKYLELENRKRSLGILSVLGLYFKSASQWLGHFTTPLEQRLIQRFFSGRDANNFIMVEEINPQIIVCCNQFSVKLSYLILIFHC